MSRKKPAKDIRDLASPSPDNAGVATKSGILANPEELRRRKQLAKQQLAEWVQQRDRQRGSDETQTG
jgi:hypothetical protein